MFTAHNLGKWEVCRASLNLRKVLTLSGLLGTLVITNGQATSFAGERKNYVKSP